MSHPQQLGLPDERTKFHGFWIVERVAAETAALRRLQNDLGNTPLTLYLIGDWKVPKTRRQECLRHVAQAFQSRLGGIRASFQMPVRIGVSRTVQNCTDLIGRRVQPSNQHRPAPISSIVVGDDSQPFGVGDAQALKDDNVPISKAPQADEPVCAAVAKLVANL